MAGAFVGGGLLLALVGGVTLGLLLRRFAPLRVWWLQLPLVGGLGFGLGNGLGVVGALLLGAPLRFDPELLLTGPWLVGGTMGTGCGTLSALVAARLGGSLQLGRWPGWKWTLAGLPAALGVMLVAASWALLLSALGHEPEAQGLATALATQQGWVRGVVLAFVMGVAPLTEEAFFRGWLQPLVRERFGARRAILGQALIFGGIHTDQLWAIPPLVLIGLVCGWLRERSGSVLPGWVLHLLNNSTAAAL
jgi:membrane protease YdiL (CAAX protease family)